MKCKICNVVIDDSKFQYHTRSHNLKSKEYYDLYIKKEGEGECIVCNGATKFKGIVSGYKIYCSSKCLLKCNTTSLTYWIHKCGGDVELAKIKQKERQTVSEKKFIEKYGVIEGVRRWKKYCDAQRYTDSEEYFIEKYGERHGPQKWKDHQTSKLNNEDVYISKYGTAEGGRRWEEFKEKSKNTIENFIRVHGDIQGKIKYDNYLINLSNAQKGSKNNMFGRPSPIGSGNGWSGWYKDWYFRSLRELSYVLYLDQSNQRWESTESKKFRIKYIDDKGNDRNYYPDFLVNGNELIEIKPNSLQGTIINKLKAEAAVIFCEKNGYSYKMLDFSINDAIIIEKYKEGQIKFLSKWEMKFKQKYLKE